ncbi:MAG TPA: NAD(+) diphosphatase [Deferrimonas sp.]
MPFLPAVAPPPTLSNNAWWFLFHGDRLLVEARDVEVAIPRWASTEDAGVLPVRTQFLGTLDGTPCYSGELAGEVGPEGTSFRALRPLLGVLSEEMFSLAGRAFQVMDWDRTHQFCGKCGGRTDPLEGERGRACAGCGLHFFPRVTPAIIVAVVRNGKILLAQSSRFPTAFYSVLAGFVEPGETFEECVHREIREEVGVEVENLRYFGSQPWPFPHSLMVGFTASYLGGDLVLEEKEIVQAGWFGAEEVLRLRIPHHGTIARQLIDRFLAERPPPDASR